MFFMLERQTDGLKCVSCALLLTQEDYRIFSFPELHGRKPSYEVKDLEVGLPKFCLSVFIALFEDASLALSSSWITVTLSTTAEHTVRSPVFWVSEPVKLLIRPLYIFCCTVKQFLLVAAVLLYKWVVIAPSIQPEVKLLNKAICSALLYGMTQQTKIFPMKQDFVKRSTVNSHCT